MTMAACIRIFPLHFCTLTLSANVAVVCFLASVPVCVNLTSRSAQLYSDVTKLTNVNITLFQCLQLQLYSQHKTWSQSERRWVSRANTQWHQRTQWEKETFSKKTHLFLVRSKCFANIKKLQFSYKIVFYRSSVSVCSTSLYLQIRGTFTAFSTVALYLTAAGLGSSLRCSVPHENLRVRDDGLWGRDGNLR